MPTTIDQTTAECHVFTYKEGLLSRVAHDLQLRVGRFRIEVDPAAPTVTATFDAASLQVVCAMQNGAPNRDALSARDRGQIEDNIRKDVLSTSRFPDIRFTSSTLRPHGGGWWVQGTLTIAGTGTLIQGTCRRQGDDLVLDLSLQQPDFGITPFSALMGAIKIQPRVDVRLSLPATALG